MQANGKKINNKNMRKDINYYTLKTMMSSKTYDATVGAGSTNTYKDWGRTWKSLVTIP